MTKKLLTASISAQLLISDSLSQASDLDIHGVAKKRPKYAPIAVSVVTRQKSCRGVFRRSS
jgi:hypothetical protein